MGFKIRNGENVTCSYTVYKEGTKVYKALADLYDKILSALKMNRSAEKRFLQ
jgi:hypothetical protein